MEICRLTRERYEQEVRDAGIRLPIEQTTAWADYQSTIDGRQSWGYVAAYDHGTVIAVASLIDYKTHGYHYLRSSHGPVWAHKPTEDEERALLDALVAFIRKADRRQVFLRLAVMADLDFCHPTLSIVPYDTTVIIDLEGGSDAILARMKPRGRRDVRKALRESPITCADETDQAMASFDEYYEVMVETANRDGFAPAPASDYENMLRILGPEHVRLYAGRDAEGRVVTWSIVTMSDGYGTRYFAASRTDTMRQHVGDKIVFFELCSVSESGLATSYDLMGIGSDLAPSLRGLNEFKCKFSKETVHVAPERDVAIKGLFYQGLVSARRILKREDYEQEESRSQGQAVKKAGNAKAANGDAPRPANLSLITGEDDLTEHLQPVVCGADILGYAYARCYHEAYGIKPIILSAIDVKVTSSSKFCDYRVVEAVGNEEGLIATLSDLGRELAAEGKVGLLHGSADWNTRIISAHKDELSEWYVVPYIDFGLLDEITQKERFYELCEELGIAYPKTWYVDCSDDAAPLDTSAFTYPLVAKPSNSASYDALEFPGKKKVYEIETEEDLRHAVSAVRASDYQHMLVVQDFVPGGDDAIYSLTTYSDAQGKMRVVAGGRVVLQDHSPLALGNPVCILSEKVPRIIEDAARFLEHVGYHGYANFDIKYDERDGSYRFFEVNTRPGKNTFYVTLGGVNFVVPIVEDWVLGHEVPYTEAYDPYVYSIVPAVVVSKSVQNKELREKVLGLYLRGKARSPHDYFPDTVAHKVWALAMRMNQIAKFKRFVWDTGGKQADVD